MADYSRRKRVKLFWLLNLDFIFYVAALIYGLLFGFCPVKSSEKFFIQNIHYFTSPAVIFFAAIFYPFYIDCKCPIDAVMYHIHLRGLTCGLLDGAVSFDRLMRGTVFCIDELIFLPTFPLHLVYFGVICYAQTEENHETWWADVCGYPNPRDCGCFVLICQICGGEGNICNDFVKCLECGRGFHTACFRPRMGPVPDGNWFCPICKTKPGTACCLMCQKLDVDLWECAKCFRHFHAECQLEARAECPDLWRCLFCGIKSDENEFIDPMWGVVGRKFILPGKSLKSLHGRTGSERTGIRRTGIGSTGSGFDSMPNSSENVSFMSAAKDLGQNQLKKNV